MLLHAPNRKSHAHFSSTVLLHLPEFAQFLFTDPVRIVGYGIAVGKYTIYHSGWSYNLGFGKKTSGITYLTHCMS